MRDTVQSSLSTTFFNTAKRFLNGGYSDSQKQQLEKFNTHYKNNFNESPEIWKLDENDKAAYKIPNQQPLLAYVKTQLGQGRAQVSSNAGNIATLAATYADDRITRRFGGGKRYDPIDLFFAELIDFSLNKLCHLEPQKAVAQLNKRITYMRGIQRIPDLFPTSMMEREHNKQSTLQMILREFESCLEYAKQEQARVCAREHFKQLLNNLQTSLIQSLNFLYYARKQKIDRFPLVLDSFKSGYDSQNNIKTQYDIRYDLIKYNTLTGRWLHKLLAIMSPIAFASAQKNIKNDDYIDELIFPWNIEIDSIFLNACNPNELDLPEWLSNPDDKIYFLKSLQAIAQGIHRWSHLIVLVDYAYQLTGEEGNRWAYGENNGRNSLEILLKLVKKEIDEASSNDAKFNNQIIDKASGNAAKFNNWIDDKIRKHNAEHRKTYGDGSAPNFNEFNAKVNLQKIATECASKNILDLQNGMNHPSSETNQHVLELKNKFFWGLQHVCEQFYPDENQRAKAIYNQKIIEFKREDKEPEKEQTKEEKVDFTDTIKPPPLKDPIPTKYSSLEHGNITKELQRFNPQLTIEKLESQFTLKISNALGDLAKQVPTLQSHHEQRNALIKWSRQQQPSFFSPNQPTLLPATQQVIKGAVKRQEKTCSDFLETMREHLGISASLTPMEQAKPQIWELPVLNAYYTCLAAALKLEEQLDIEKRFITLAIWRIREAYQLGNPSNHIRLSILQKGEVTRRDYIPKITKALNYIQYKIAHLDSEAEKADLIKFIQTTRKQTTQDFNKLSSLIHQKARTALQLWINSLNTWEQEVDNTKIDNHELLLLNQR